VSEESVTVEMIMATLMANVSLAKEVIRRVVRRLPTHRQCACAQALATAVMTDWKVIPEATLAALEPLVGKYRKQA
jgi:5'-methylthioadenosine phosphorylase